MLSWACLCKTKCILCIRCGSICFAWEETICDQRSTQKSAHMIHNSSPFLSLAMIERTISFHFWHFWFALQAFSGHGNNSFQNTLHRSEGKPPGVFLAFSLEMAPFSSLSVISAIKMLCCSAGAGKSGAAGGRTWAASTILARRLNWVL